MARVAEAQVGAGAVQVLPSCDSGATVDQQPSNQASSVHSVTPAQVTQPWSTFWSPLILLPLFFFFAKFLPVAGVSSGLNPIICQLPPPHDFQGSFPPPCNNLPTNTTTVTPSPYPKSSINIRPSRLGFFYQYSPVVSAIWWLLALLDKPA